jgi:tight adherence protein B
MIYVIVLFFSLSAFFLFYYVLQRFLLSDRRLQKRMKAYLLSNKEGKKPIDRKKFDFIVQIQSYKRTVKEKVLSKKKNDKLEDALSRAGIPLKPEEFVLFQWIFVALSSGTGYAVGGHWLFLLLGLAAGWAVPPWWLRKRQADRLQQFNDGLPDMITTIVSSLRAGFSFAQSLKAVVEEADEPIKSEIDMVLKEMQYGATMESALHSLKERVPSEDLELMIQAILIQKQVGGNLATILETIVDTIRERNKIHRHLRTLTAQGRLSGLVIGLLPFGIGIMIYLMEPEHIQTLFNDPIGIVMVAAGFVSGSIGFLLIKKVTTIEV